MEHISKIVQDDMKRISDDVLISNIKEKIKDNDYDYWL
jgi:hypothetical protein